MERPVSHLFFSLFIWSYQIRLMEVYLGKEESTHKKDNTSTPFNSNMQTYNFWVFCVCYYLRLASAMPCSANSLLHSILAPTNMLINLFREDVFIRRKVSLLCYLPCSLQIKPQTTCWVRLFTGTTCSPLLPKSKQTGKGRKTGKGMRPSIRGNAATAYGQHSEPKAQERYATTSKEDVFTCGLAVCPKNPWLGAPS